MDTITNNMAQLQTHVTSLYSLHSIHSTLLHSTPPHTNIRIHTQTKATFKNCPESGERIWFATVTLADIQKAAETGEAPLGQGRRQLLRVPSKAERNRCYQEAARAIEYKETIRLPPHGGRKWKVLCTMTEKASGNRKRPPLFRWFRGKLELASLPQFLEDVPGALRTKRKGLPKHQTQEEEEDAGITATSLCERPSSQLSRMAWNDPDCSRPKLKLQWISPNQKTFSKRQTAELHAADLVEQDLIIDKVLFGYGVRGQKLRPTKPTRAEALKAGRLRFLRDGLWIVGQEEEWQADRADDLEREEREDKPADTTETQSEEQARKKRKLSALDVFLKAKREQHQAQRLEELKEQDENPSCTLKQAETELREQWKTLTDDERSVWTRKRAKLLGEDEGDESEEDEQEEEEEDGEGEGEEEEEASDGNTEKPGNVDKAETYHASEHDDDTHHDNKQKETDTDKNHVAAAGTNERLSVDGNNNAVTTNNAADPIGTDNGTTKQTGFDLFLQRTRNGGIKHLLPAPARRPRRCVVSESPKVRDVDTQPNSRAHSLQIWKKLSEKERQGWNDKATSTDSATPIKTHNPCNSSGNDNNNDNNNNTDNTDNSESKNTPGIVTPGDSEWEVDDGADGKDSDESYHCRTDETDSTSIALSDSTHTTSEQNITMVARPRRTPIRDCKPRRFNQSSHWRLTPEQICLCYDAAIDHYERVMDTVKARALFPELTDGFDVLRERGRGRYDMELPVFETPLFRFLTDLQDAPWMPVVREILGEDVVLIHKGCFLSLPGSDAQDYHQDGPHLSQKVQRPCHAINVFVPLVDLSLRNGPTEFQPGSHILGHDGYHRSKVLIPTPPAGTPVIFDYRLGHRGLANSSTHCRPIVYCTYAAAANGKEFRDKMNFSSKRYHKFGGYVERPLSREERAKKRRQSQEERA